MKQGVRSSKWMLVLAFISLKAVAQERHEFSVNQAVDYAMKNSAQVKNALIEVSIQEQTNKEITAQANARMAQRRAGQRFLTTAMPPTLIGISDLRNTGR